MKYRHRFHAGNFADVHKHTALLALLHALQRKERGLLYVDTHAGAGVYDLSGPDSRHAGEARYGIGRLLAAPELLAPELDTYRRAVLAWRAEHGQAHGYPGSPLLIGAALRAQDRGLCCEQLPQQCRALRSALVAARRVAVECTDGYAGLIASVPPIERRCLALIDPPYEDPASDILLAQRTLAQALQRLGQCVIALWYPLKDERWLARWQQQLAAALPAPAVCLELWLYPRDAGVALNGSGLLVVNAPWQFAARAEQWQHELAALLDTGQTGGSAVRVLVDESVRHGSA